MEDVNKARTAGPVTQAATTGAVVAGAVTTIVVWLLSLAGVQVPELVAGALTTLLTAAGAWVGGWSVKPLGSHRADS